MEQPSRDWRTADHDPEIAARLQRDCGLHPAVARVLAARGLTDDASVSSFLEPRLSSLSDPFELPDMAAGVDRVLRALETGEHIAVFGDYDVDGISSAALMVRVLRHLGAKVDPFLPLRLEEGYGLSVDALERCLTDLSPTLILTVDCGTASRAAVEHASRRGVDVVITDHHEPGPSVAKAVAVINPKLGSNDHHKMLAGVGVAFKLAHALLKRGREIGVLQGRDLDLRQHLDLVALGTVADIVPLLAENRILVRHGLLALGSTTKAGLNALARVAGVTEGVDAYDVGFRLGPRLNASGRLGDAQRALSLLLEEDETRAHAIAAELDAANRERQSIERQILEQALEMAASQVRRSTSSGIVVGHADWHSGVIGIVASRLMQRFGRPTICLAWNGDAGKGSCRSVEGFNMAEALQRCAPHLNKYGGHAMAAGLEISRGKLEAFQETFEVCVAEFAAGRTLRPVQRIDAWITLPEANDALCDALEPLKPFGCAHQVPIWAAQAVQLVDEPRVLKDKHSKFTVECDGARREAIAFNLLPDAIPAGRMDLAFQLKRDTFRGRAQLVLNVQDVRPSTAATPSMRRTGSRRNSSR